MRILKLISIFIFVVIFVGSIEAKTVEVLRFSGVINPMAASYIIRGITKAEENKAECVIIQIDTPGGLDSSMRKIVQKILDTKIPVIVQVYPKGARSASAGLFVALASDHIAMASGTNLGAAHPVDMAGKFASEKITNDAAAYIRSIAEKRSRDVKWAEDAVRKSVSITETEALKNKIIDVIADNEHDLITKLDGKKIKTMRGEVVLDLRGVEIKYIKMSKRESFFHVLGDPNIAYILFIIGIYGLIYELASPGAVLPGVAGTICIILALVSFESLSVSFAGIALLILAVVLFILEIKSPTHGALATGGFISMILGSLLMFNPMVPYFRISLIVVATVAVITGLFFAFLVSIGIAGLKGKIDIGIKSLIGATGEVRVKIDPVGIVFVNKEDWSAVSRDNKPIKKGEKITVLAVEGVKLIVEPVKEK